MFDVNNCTVEEITSDDPLNRAVFFTCPETYPFELTPERFESKEFYEKECGVIVSSCLQLEIAAGIPQMYLSPTCYDEKAHAFSDVDWQDFYEGEDCPYGTTDALIAKARRHELDILYSSINRIITDLLDTTYRLRDVTEKIFEKKGNEQ